MEIPPEIITNIHHRLPVKSIGRFRSVSKNWLAQLTHPQFIKTHQTTFTRNHLICGSDDGSLYTLPLNQQDEEKPTKLVLQLPYKDSFTFHGSCNGLVLGSSDGVKRFDSHSLVVFNPTTKELVQLPESKYEKIDIVENMLNVDILYGFGYDSVSDDYKVVIFSYFHYDYLNPPEHMFVHVYSLRNNKWGELMDAPYENYHVKSVPGVFVHGFLHWIAIRGFVPVIVGFSVADEAFSEVSLPDLGDVCDVMSKNECQLVGLGEKLGMFVGDELWVMNEYGARESWEKISIRGLGDGEVLVVEPKVFYDNGEILLISGNLMWTDDVKEKTFCGIIDVSKDIKGLKVKGSYVESFASPKLSQTNQEPTNISGASCKKLKACSTDGR